MAPEVQEILTPEALEALQPEWTALHMACPSLTPFSAPEWLIPWWRHIGQGELWTLALRDSPSGRLVGLFPAYLYAQPQSGERMLFPLGIATTDYLDALFAPGTERIGMAAVFAHLQACRDRWDICECPQLRPGSPLLAADAPKPWLDQTVPSEVCPALRLPSTVDGLAETLPALPRRKLRYYHRRAERLGRMRAERARSVDEAIVLYDALLRLHGVRWQERGESGVLADPAVQRAHRDAIPRLLTAGTLRLYGLWLNDEIIGCVYALIDRPTAAERCLYFYIGGFDPSYSEIAPGSVLIGHAIEDAVRDGCAAVDFLRGEESYKYVWGASNAPTYCRRLRHGADPAERR